MTKSEFCTGWERLRAVYPNLPKLDASVGGEWYKVLQLFSAEDYNGAISDWIANERFKPVPAELARYCSRAHRRRLALERAAAQRGGDPCPWCGGGGYVCQVLEPESRDLFFPCCCAASPDPETGAKVLAAAIDDSAWGFDKRDHAFRRRRSWLISDRPATAEEYRQFRKAARGVGFKMNG